MENCQVGKTQPVTYGVGGRHGYGFNVQSIHGAPVLTITYATEAAANAAERLMRQVLEKAVDVTGHSRL